MLHSIKPSPLHFNLLYLDSGENLINSIKCYFLNNSTMNLEEGKLHLNTRSIIFQPDMISEHLTKLKHSENLSLKVFSLEEIIHNSNIQIVNNFNNDENTFVSLTGKDQINTNIPSTNNNANNFNNINPKNNINVSSLKRKSAIIQNQNYSNLVLNNNNNISVSNNANTGNISHANDSSIKNAGISARKVSAILPKNPNNFNFYTSNNINTNINNHINGQNSGNIISINPNNNPNLINNNYNHNYNNNIFASNNNIISLNLNSNNQNNISLQGQHQQYHHSINLSTNLSNVVFDFKITNFCEVFNKIIKENPNFLTNQNQLNPYVGTSNANPLIINNTNNNNRQNYNNSNIHKLNSLTQAIHNTCAANSNNIASSNINNSCNITQNSNKNLIGNNINYINNNNNNNNVHVNRESNTITLTVSNNNGNNNNHNFNSTSKKAIINSNPLNSQQNLSPYFIMSSNISSNANVSNIFTFDIQNYFYENNLNYQSFVDLLAFINTTFNKELHEKNSNKTKYLICLAKCNKTHNIFRSPVINYEIFISPKKYFFIIEGDEDTLNAFMEDNAFINNRLNKTDEDTFAIYNKFVLNKIFSEFNKYEVDFPEHDDNNNHHHKNNLNENNLSPILNPSKRLSQKDASNAHYDKRLSKNMNMGKNSLENTLAQPSGHKQGHGHEHGHASNQEDLNLQEINKNLGLFDRDNNFLFNPHNSQYEENEYSVIKKFIVSRVVAEGIQKGILLVYANNTVKFKPIINNYKNKNLEFSLSRVQFLVKYRYYYRYKAINIFLFQSQRSKIFDFESEKEFQDFYDYIYKHAKNLDKNYDDIEHYTNLWKFGLMTNFEYLIYLNTQASRSFNDLSQYPIFPWILTNYEDVDEIDLSDSKNYRDLTKPIGALAQYKLERFLHNYSEMKKNNPKENAYIYSDFYSIPSHVIYFLIRSHPLYQMKVKNGSFGPPDRLFNNIRDCFLYILNINNEVKELTPEFYSGNGDFLLNIFNLSLGKTNSGNTVDDVILPKWAKSSSHFISVMKAALESKYVSTNINSWIDLIFGCKQQSDSAIAANNLYYYMTYESALELNVDKNFNFENDFKKQAFFTQLSEYGQTPRRLFERPHAVKNLCNALNIDELISPNSDEEIKEKISHLAQENRKLEEHFILLEKEKFEEKEILIKSHNEIEAKRREKIKSLKDKLDDREKEYKRAIEKMIEHNNQMKIQFDNYDEIKNRFYSDVIDDMEKNVIYDFDNKFTNKTEISKYIKNIETSINKLKIREEQLSETLNDLESKNNKIEKRNSHLKGQIENIKKKFNNIPH